MVKLEVSGYYGKDYGKDEIPSGIHINPYMMRVCSILGHGEKIKQMEILHSELNKIIQQVFEKEIKLDNSRLYSTEFRILLKKLHPNLIIPPDSQIVTPTDGFTGFVTATIPNKLISILSHIAGVFQNKKFIVKCGEYKVRCNNGIVEIQTRERGWFTKWYFNPLHKEHDLIILNKILTESESWKAGKFTNNEKQFITEFIDFVTKIDEEIYKDCSISPIYMTPTDIMKVGFTDDDEQFITEFIDFSSQLKHIGYFQDAEININNIHQAPEMIADAQAINEKAKELLMNYQTIKNEYILKQI